MFSCGLFCVSVCQETVWEAFKIFWDRLPEQDEYRVWVGRCMDGSVSVMDIGSFFSQSEEHVSLIRTVSASLCIHVVFTSFCSWLTTCFWCFCLSESCHDCDHEQVSSTHVFHLLRVSRVKTRPSRPGSD